MSDVELLFLVLALIYTWECACWLRVGSTAFTTWFGSKWRQAEPVSMLGNQSGGFVIAPFLPPLGTVLTSHPYPVNISPEGITAVTVPTRGNKPRPDHYRFEEIRKVEAEGKKVRLNAQFFVKAPSPTMALHVAARIKEIQKLMPAARENILKKNLHESFEVRSIKKRWASFSVGAANLRLLTNALFLYLFIFAPLMIWRLGLPNCWPSLLAGLFALTFTIAFAFRRLHKHFYPAAADDRFTHFLINMFSPATTIRARDVLSRPLLETFHPLAIARVFCTEAEFKRLARSALLDLRYPMSSRDIASESKAGEIERYFKTSQNAALEVFLKKNGIKAEELLKPPTPADATCLSYCPRCESQFTSAQGNCADCGGLALVAFPRTGKSGQPQSV
jgi:hypothetical protein